MRRALLTLCVLLGTAAPASAHSLVRVEEGQLRYLSADSTSHNTVTIRDTGGSYRITDPTVDGGMDAGPCTPLQVDSNGYITEVDCAKSGITSLRVDIGEQDDTATLQASLPSIVLGGPGNDTLGGTDRDDVVNGEDGSDKISSGGGNDTVTGGAGDDAIDGADGNDVLHGGAGVDDVKGGGGDDDIRTQDGAADTVDCGEGTDVVTGDEADAVPAEAACETVNRAAGAGGDAGQPESTVVKADRVAPLLGLGGAVVQRARRRLVLLAAASEAGTLSVACTVRAAGRRYRLRRRTATIPVDGAGVAVTFALPRKVAAAVRSALRRRKGVTARFTVTAQDRAGNRSAAGVRTVRLRR